MKTSYVALLPPLSVGMAFLCGCGGSGGTSIGIVSNPAPAVHTAYVVQSNGTTSSIVAIPIASDDTTTTASTLSAPTGLLIRTVATDSSGNIYVGGILSSGGGEVAVYAAGSSGSATPTHVIAGGSTGLQSPLSMTVDKSGQLYVSDLNANSTMVFASGANGNVAPSRTLMNVSGFGMATDAAGELFVAAFPGITGVAVFSPTANGSATPIRTIEGSATLMQAIVGIAVDSTGNLYVANIAADSINVFAAGANGNVAPTRTIAGNNTTLANPEDLAVDSTGVLYLCDVGTFTNDTNPSVDVFASGATGNVSPIAHVVTAQWTQTLDAVFALY